MILCAYAAAWGTLGVAASLTRCYKTRGRAKGAPPRIAYDPNQSILAGHCMWASLLHAYGVVMPTLQETHILRRWTTRLWARNPEMLAQVADRENLPPQKYLEGISTRMWGGLPDIILYVSAVDLPIQVYGPSGELMYSRGGADAPRVQWQGQHYVVLKSRAWRRQPADPFKWLRRRTTRKLGAADLHADVSNAARGGAERSRSRDPPHTRAVRSPARLAEADAREPARLTDERLSNSSEEDLAEAAEPVIDRAHGLMKQLMHEADQEAADWLQHEQIPQPVMVLEGEQHIQDRALHNFSTNFPEAVLELRSGHRRCVLCHRWLTAEHTSTARHVHGVAAWLAETPERQRAVIVRQRQLDRLRLHLPQPLPEDEYVRQLQHVRLLRQPYPQARGGAGSAVEDSHEISSSQFEEMNANTEVKPEPQDSLAAADQDQQSLLAESLAPELYVEENTGIQIGEDTDLSQTKCEASSDLEDADLAEALIASSMKDRDLVGDVDRFWSVLCCTATRHITARMELTTRLSDLMVSLAPALKWPSRDISLMCEGALLPATCCLGQLEPPYIFEILKRTILPPAGRKVCRNRPIIAWDIGYVESSDHQPREIPSTRDCAGNGGGSCGSSDPPPSSSPAEAKSEQLETSQMGEEDHDVKLACLKRARSTDQLIQFRSDTSVGQLVEHLASLKRVRKDGFSVFAKTEQSDALNDGQEYFVTWSKQARGGEGSVDTTVTYVPSSEVESMDEQAHCAQVHLSQLEDLLHRIKQANAMLQAFKRDGAYSLRTVHLRDLASVQGRLAVLARGGAPKKSNPSEASMLPGRRWESTEALAGLTLSTIVKVQRDPQNAGDLPPINSDRFVAGAEGYALLSWDTWTSHHATLSERPLLAVLPGDRLEAVKKIAPFGMSEPLSVKWCLCSKGPVMTPPINSPRR